MVSALDRKLLRDLLGMKSQVLTIALVVACGIGGFVGSFGTYDSLAQSRDRYYAHAGFAHVFATLVRAPDSMAHRLQDIPGVIAVDTRTVFDVQLDIAGVVQPVSARMIGTPLESRPLTNRLTLRSGRWIRESATLEALVNERFMQARGLALGDEVHALLNGKREPVRIVGTVLSPEYIYSSRGGALPDDEWFGIFWVDARRLAAAYDRSGSFNSVAVRLASGASERQVIAGLDALLARYGSRGAVGRGDQLSHKILEQEITEQRTIATVIPAIFLVVAVFILNVVLSRLVATQRGQIAALKALGYGNGTLVVHYLKFAVAIVALGIGLGALIGEYLVHSLTALYARYFHFPEFDVAIDPGLFAVASGITLAGALAGALHAIHRVVTLPPAQAMQPPTPPVFRRAVLERIGLGRLVGPGGRMIVRNLERRPGRATVVVLGVAASIAIIISGSFWGDAVDWFIDLQFRTTQAGDVYVGFTEVRPRSVRHELERLPGVHRAEVSRTVTVRLHHAGRTYRTAIQGVESDALLSRVVDRTLAVVPPPPEGLMITTLLARQLSAREGDVLRVELLDGRRRERELVVTRIADTLAGVNGTMTLAALQRLTGDGDVVNGAALLVDAARRNALFAELKRMPGVATVIVKSSLLDAFRATTARNLLVYTTILTVFAATIAAGVIYNAARIALAERAWELASLRVLGLTRGEVSGLLLGELALELVAAIPIGFGCGFLLAAAIVTMTAPETFSLPVIVWPRTYAYAGITMLVAGVASALVVRRRIDQLDLVAVLKTRG